MNGYSSNGQFEGQQPHQFGGHTPPGYHQSQQQNPQQQQQQQQHQQANHHINHGNHYDSSAATGAPFSSHSSLDDSGFSDPNKEGGVFKSFDAFPKTKPTYLTRSRSGNAWTLALLALSVWLLVSETRRWFAGTTTHTFSVEKGVSHALQINIDIVVAMRCHDLHVNVQDAAGDRILAGEMLKKDDTAFGVWGRGRDAHHHLANTYDEDVYGQGEDEDVHEYLGAARSKKKFSKTPRLRGDADACRIYGSIEGNKVMGDFHITARGHGYLEFGQHLDHSLFNFSHHINELSFGPYYPSLVNPLDNTVSTTERNFYKFQYYCNVVPTIYTTDVHRLSLSPPHTDEEVHYSRSTVYTNQYAVTEQSRSVAENFVPGVFFKYDIEPILLIVHEESGGSIALLVRLVNVISGVLVAGSWFWQFTDWALETWGKSAGGRDRLGFLGTKDEKYV